MALMATKMEQESLGPMGERWSYMVLSRGPKIALQSPPLPSVLTWSLKGVEGCFSSCFPIPMKDFSPGIPGTPPW